MSIKEEIQKAIDLLNSIPSTANSDARQSALEAAEAILSEARQEIMKHQSNPNSPLVQGGVWWKFYNRITDAYEVTVQELQGWRDVESAIGRLVAIKESTQYY